MAIGLAACSITAGGGALGVSQAAALAIPDREIYTVPAGGGGLHRVTVNRFQDSDPAWSPDGSRLFFSRARRAGYVSGASDIWSITPDGGGQRREIRASGTQSATDPEPSPDGRLLAFSVFGRDGSGSVQVASRRTSGRAIWVREWVPGYSWMPDSSALLHSGGSVGGLTIENPLDATQLDAPAGLIGAVAVAHDGRIAFVRGGHLWIAGADGNGAVRLQARGSVRSSIGSVSFSPDGARIAFDWLRCPARSLDIYVIGSDGSGLRRLTGGRFRGPLPRRKWSVSPSWSPDGTTIAFARSGIFSELDPCVAP